jgi:tetratricopeptide (TPR) repeat protein
MHTNEQNLINNILNLREQYNKYDEIDKLVDEYLTNNKASADLLIRLAIFFEQPPIADEQKTIELAEKALEIDSKNPYAVIILAYVYYYCLGSNEIPDYVYQKLANIYNVNPNIQAMIEYVKSWYWKRKDSAKYVESLKKSISLCDKFVKNYDDFGDYYRHNNELAKSIEMYRAAFINIKNIYNDSKEQGEDILDEFLNESIKGTSVTEERYKILEAMIR